MFVDSFALFPIFLCITYILCCFFSAPVLYSPAFMQVFFKSCYVAALRRRGAGNWISSQCSQFRRWLGGAGGSDDDPEEKVPEGKEQQPSRFEVGLRWHKSGCLKSSMVSSSKLHHFHYWLCVSLIWVAVPACMSRSFIERARTFFVPLATALKRSRGLIMGLCLSLPLEEHLKRALEKIEKDRCFNCGEFLRDTRLKLPEAIRTKLFWSNLVEFSSPSSKDCPKVPFWFQLRQLSPNLPCLFSSGFDALQEHECEALDWQEWENHLASISHFCGQDRKGPGLWDLHGHCNLAEHCVARTGKGAIFIGTSALLYARPKDFSYVSIAHLCHAAFSNQPWPLVSVSHCVSKNPFLLRLMIVEADADASCYPDHADDVLACPSRSANVPWIQVCNVVLQVIYTTECCMRAFVERENYVPFLKYELRFKMNWLDCPCAQSGTFFKTVAASLMSFHSDWTSLQPLVVI